LAHVHGKSLLENLSSFGSASTTRTFHLSFFNLYEVTKFFLCGNFQDVIGLFKTLVTQLQDRMKKKPATFVGEMPDTIEELYSRFVSVAFCRTSIKFGSSTYEQGWEPAARLLI